MNARQGSQAVAVLLGLLAGCQTTSSRHEAARIPSPATAYLQSAKTAASSQSRTGSSEIIRTSNVEPINDGKTSPETAAKIQSEVVVPASAESAAMELSIGLEDAVATSLVQNPDLVAIRGQEGVSSAALGVAQTYPWNPFIQSQILPSGNPRHPGNGPGSGSGKGNYYIWVMQRFELAHQRRHREESAAAALNQVRWNIQQMELTNIAQTTRLYFTAVYQHDLYELAKESAALHEKLLGIVERRFKANLATAAEFTTAKVAARQNRKQADLGEATYHAALLALRQQLNIPLTESMELLDRLDNYSWQPVRSLESSPAEEGTGAIAATSLAAELVEGRPDVMAASAGIMVASANEQLALAARIPDLQAGPIYETADDGTRFMGFRVQTDIPVWNNGNPLAHQRHMEWHQQSLTFNQLRTRAALEAQMAIDRYERARRLATDSPVELSRFVDQTPPELREILAQFEAGQADVLAVHATQNNLILERRTHLDLLNELALSAAGVVQATAVPLNHLITGRAKQ